MKLWINVEQCGAIGGAILLCLSSCSSRVSSSCAEVGHGVCPWCEREHTRNLLMGGQGTQVRR
jgi:hypothetical protein